MINKTEAQIEAALERAEAAPEITVSDREPTAADGKDGDIWVVV